MTTYKAPLDDMRFILNDVLNVSQLSKIKAFETLDAGMIDMLLPEVAKFSQNVLHPLNAVGDKEGCAFDAKTRTVRTPKGFKDAYKQLCDMGLPTFTCDPKYDGLGMPLVLGAVFNEMLCSSNMAFGMYPGLSHAAYNALNEFATDEMKALYLPKLVSGEWAGTMCLTEPDAGTDLGIIKTKAKKQADGTYAITGTKIFISGGEQDLTPNICHLVLAKIDDPSTPPGTDGISLFLVPKFIPDAKGKPGERNAAFCGRIEEKMGIHGSSTCEMNFEGAKGFLIGAPNKGMKEMFVMMNEARMGVGIQGIGLSEIAYQNAVLYAQERLQGPAIDEPLDKSKPPVAIIRHPDIRRELLSIRSAVEGERMLAYWFTMQVDLAKTHPDAATREHAQKLVELLTPIVKAHFTDNAVKNTSSAIQVLGGHGYITDNGMEQFLRDARILQIYEGANGIQALDLLGKKVLAWNLLPTYLAEVKADLYAAKRHGVPAALIAPVEEAMIRLAAATQHFEGALNAREMTKTHKILGKKVPTVKAAKLYLEAKMNHAPLTQKEIALDMASMASDYLKLASLVAMGHMWVKMVDVAQQKLAENPTDRAFYETKIQTAQFYMERVMPEMYMLEKTLQSGAKTLTQIAAENFAHTQGGGVGNSPTATAKPAQNQPQTAGKRHGIGPLHW